jgi:hypothetical protein
VGSLYYALAQGKEIERLNSVYNGILKNAGCDMLGAFVGLSTVVKRFFMLATMVFPAHWKRAGRQSRTATQLWCI